MIKYCINEIKGKASVLVDGKYLNDNNKLIDSVFYWDNSIEASKALVKYIENKA